MTTEEIVDAQARIAQGKAAYEFFTRNIYGGSAASWKETDPDARRKWTALVTAGDDAYLAEYRRLLEHDDDQP